MPPPPLTRLPPVRYIIAGNKRAGTSLLADGLSQIGNVGSPREYFGAQQRQRWERRWGLRRPVSFHTYLQEVLTRSRTPNGVIGLKLHWTQLMDLQQVMYYEKLGRVQLLWPQVRYIHMIRRDTLAQAISLYRAEQSQAWFRWAWAAPQRDGPRMVFDPDAIRHMQTDVQTQQARWEAYLTRWQVPVLTVAYEELATDYEATLRRVVHWLGVDPTGLVIPPSRLGIQRDALSAAWQARLAQKDGP